MTDPQVHADIASLCEAFQRLVDAHHAVSARLDALETLTGAPRGLSGHSIGQRLKAVDAATQEPA